ncbi:MAG: class I SAM-dependent methyltransferase [Acidobacteria bacterium]|nr:class I SAM-dependent methyltransferase [Acidobacteriota bacterium]
MTEETVHSLDPEALDIFARKGTQGGPDVPQAGPANGVKVRRVLQLTRDFARRPFEDLRILDLGCGEGVYAIEASLRGAEVLAVDARTGRMEQGAACAARHGLANVRFVQGDVRNVTRDGVGSFDVVYLLGLLYHLDAPDLFAVLEKVHDLCDGVLVVDTLVSLTAECEVAWRDRTYQGRRVREHEDGDPDDVRRGRALRSIDNTFSLRLTRRSLLSALHDAGFTSVCEGHVPFEPGKAEDRVTLVALKGTPVLLSTYPWVNGRSEGEIERTLHPPPPSAG